MTSNNELKDISPIKKKMKYKLYKNNPDALVPLRTLNRWAAKKSDHNSNQSSEEVLTDKIRCRELITSNNSYDEQSNDSSDQKKFIRL